VPSEQDHKAGRGNQSVSDQRPDAERESIGLENLGLPLRDLQNFLRSLPTRDLEILTRFYLQQESTRDRDLKRPGYTDLEVDLYASHKHSDLRAVERRVHFQRRDESDYRDYGSDERPGPKRKAFERGIRSSAISILLLEALTRSCESDLQRDLIRSILRSEGLENPGNPDIGAGDELSRSAQG